ncbi:MAG: aminopeptidase P family protein [Candidatus Rokubacteria bacterium]|nr:aminopeptidase P family protein [Candidatus Rokubacteria bacterium]
MRALALPEVVATLDRALRHAEGLSDPAARDTAIFEAVARQTMALLVLGRFGEANARILQQRERAERLADARVAGIYHMSFVGYRTCYYRTFSVGRATRAQIAAYRKAREWMDEAIALTKPGVGTDKIARAFPKAQEIGFESEMAAFGLHFCHGIGLGLGLHERPIISRVNSFDDPMELQAGMMTYCPATDGTSAARIEEEVIVTPEGAKIITLFPAEELPIANRY